MSDIWSLRPESIPSRPREPTPRRFGSARVTLAIWKRRLRPPRGPDHDRCSSAELVGVNQPSRGDERGTAHSRFRPAQVNSGIGRERGIPIRFTLS